MVCLETSFVIDYLRGKENVRIIINKLRENNDTLTIASPSIIELISGIELEEIKKEKEDIIKFLFSIEVLSLENFEQFWPEK